MPSKRKQSPGSRRRSSSLKRRARRAVKRRTRSGTAEKEILHLVQEGIEKFILKDATVEEFLRTIRALTDRRNIYSHPLTGPALQKIIKDVARKRSHRRPR